MIIIMGKKKKKLESINYMFPDKTKEGTNKIRVFVSFLIIESN